MKFLFFKSRSEEKKSDSFAATPPRVSVPAAPAAPPPAAAPVPVATEPEPATPVPTIPFAIATILPQLPVSLKTNAAFASTTIAIPVERLLPKLASGKVALPLKDILALVPADRIPQPLPIVPALDVVLPLDLVIAAIPPHLLAIKHEFTVTLDNLPALFEEPVAPTPAPATPPAKTLSPIAGAGRTEQPSAAPHVALSLRTLIAALPDNVLAGPRAALWRRVDATATVPVPLDLILPQLRNARVRLPLNLLVSLVPPTVLVNPLPELVGEIISIPLADIVMQLPPDLFVAQLSEPISFDDEIPTPFEEKIADQPTPEPPPAVAAPEPVAEQSPSIDTAALADDSFAVFSEQPAATPEPAFAAEATPAPEPIVAPATEEPTPIVEPVAEIPTAPPPPAEICAIPHDPATTKFLVNLNQCIADDLMTIEGIGAALAQRIIAFRDARGGFQSVDELHEIAGIGRKTFRALTGVRPRTLNRLLGVPEDQELTLQEIMRLTGTLPGIDGCLLAMADGVFLTGKLPAHLDQNTVSVFAPQLFKKVGRYTKELQVGNVRRMTLFTDQQPVSIFEAGDVYLIVIHDTRRFSKALLRRCERISQEIARLCRQRAVV